MADIIPKFIKVKTQQIVGAGVFSMINKEFMLTDLIVSSTSQGHVTVLARDDKNKHTILSFRGSRVFNHTFSHGFPFWKDARLDIIKGTNDGVVNVSCGYILTHSDKNYDKWSEI